MSSASLLVIGNQEGLSWILESQRMAFSPSATAGRRLTRGDQLFLYTTRKCFKNPTRDVGRVIGCATVISPIARLSAPVKVAKRTFPYGCNIQLDSLAPLGTGVPLRDLVYDLDAFRKNPQSWQVWLRRTLLPLSTHDANLIARHLASVTQRPEDVLESYLR